MTFISLCAIWGCMGEARKIRLISCIIGSRDSGLSRSAVTTSIFGFVITVQILAVIYNNLGLAYTGKGEYIKAIEYLQKALKIDLNKLGPEHPDVARDYSNLGLTYEGKGDYEEAIENFQKSLKINLKKFGPEHPDVARGYNNLGMTYYDKGNYDKAIEYFQKALDIARKSLGSNHPYTKIIQKNFNYAKGSQLSQFSEGIDTREQ